MVQRKITEQVF